MSASSAELQCTAEGFVTMVSDIVGLALTFVTIYVSTIRGILSGAPDLSKAFELTYAFVKGNADWLGYLVAGIYYFGEDPVPGTDFTYGTYLCQYAGYGYYVIYYLELAVTFGQG